MADTCFHLLRFIRTRFVQLDPDGTFASGADNLYVSDSQVSLAFSYNNEAGDDFTQKNGNGDICFAYLEPDKVKNITHALVFCDHDPSAQVLLIGGARVSEGGNVIGAAIPRVGTTGNEDGVGLEGWTLNITGSGIDPTYPYVRHVFGKTRWTPADKTLENGPIVNAFSGVSFENPLWFDGPMDDCPFALPDEWSSLYAYFGDTTIPDATCGTQVYSTAS